MSISRPSFVCVSCTRALAHTIAKPPHSSTRPFSLSASRSVDDSTPEDADHVPRWKREPKSMTMPIRLRPQPKQPAWTVNDDDEKLNQVYDQLLTGLGGPSVRGRHVLDEQVKWVAITHKSFSHGRLGFNDRLAYLGKRILDLQTSLALLNSPPNPAAITPPARHVFQHPALSTLSNITPTIKESTLNRLRLSTVAMQYGLEHVVRWKPKKSDDLKLSGIDAVLAQALYAIVGAVALQKGGKQADRLARTRILAPLGLR